MSDYLISSLLILILILYKYSTRRNHTTKAGAPWVPLEPHVINRIFELVQIKPGDIFYDLGSGDGRMVIAAASLGAKAYGIEIDPWRVWYSRFCIFLFGLSGKAHVIKKNIFDVDISDADVVTLYLLQETNNLLFPKLKKELKPGTRVLSSAFNFPKWKPVTIDPTGPIYGPLHLYHIK
jgi:SAM-dependent methyltransferase